MPQKVNMIERLTAEKKALEDRRDQILDEVDKERMELSDEYPSPVIEDLLSELQTLVDNIFQLENTIRLLRETKNNSQKVGKDICVGDYVILKANRNERQYFIAEDSYYVNPTIGIISSSSPIAKQLLGQKFGGKLDLVVNGVKSEYKLMPS